MSLAKWLIESLIILFLDKYFNFNLDISEAIILLTANYLKKVPQFVKDRCKPVNIELLTYQQRKDILILQAKDYLTEYSLEHLELLFSEQFLEMCITETWGIRGGINNLMTTIDFLDELEGDGLANQLTDLASYDELYETPLEEYKKREEGVIKLSYLLGEEKRELVLTKRIGIETRMFEGEEIKEIITGTDKEIGKAFVSGWPEKYWWGGEVVREI